MTFTALELPGVWLIDPVLHADERGVLRRSFCAEEFRTHGLAETVLQGNISANPHAGTLRGFHYQLPPYQEAKTITCVGGALFDIVADIRPDSPTFMRWVGVELSAASGQSLHVPAGCANAWLTMAPHTVVHYYMSELYVQASYRGFRYNDPSFGFCWPEAPRLISDKDRSFPDFDPAVVRER